MAHPFIRDLSMYNNMQNKICYLAPNTKFLKPIRSLFSGHDDGWRVHGAMGLLKEIEIINMYEMFFQHWSIDDLRHKQEQFLYLESQPVAFELSHWKVSSVFIVSVFLLGLACIVFCCRSFERKYYN